jgi:hypothetical protein
MGILFGNPQPNQMSTLWSYLMYGHFVWKPSTKSNEQIVELSDYHCMGSQMP